MRIWIELVIVPLTVLIVSDVPVIVLFTVVIVVATIPNFLDLDVSDSWLVISDVSNEPPLAMQS